MVHAREDILDCEVETLFKIGGVNNKRRAYFEREYVVGYRGILNKTKISYIKLCPDNIYVVAYKQN